MTARKVERWRIGSRLVIMVLVLLGFTVMGNATNRDILVYVGTYTRGGGDEGIHVLRFNPQAESLETVGLAAPCSNPSFVALHPDGRHLYAVGESGEPDGNQVIAFSIDQATGSLTRLNQESSGGLGPCHLVVDPSGRWLLVANYSDGGVATLQILEDGRIGSTGARLKHEGTSVDPDRQTGPHPHSINLTPDASRALVADLGLDKVMIYQFNPVDGSLTPNAPPWATVAPGSGPRHLAFHPDISQLFLLNEMAATLSTFTYDPATVAMEEIQTISMLPEGYEGERSGAEVVAHPNGRFVYASNRGHDSIAVFAVDPESGRLTSMGQTPSGGRNPRNFAIDPSGKFLFSANQNSDLVVVFRIGTDGRLESTGMSASVPRPICVRFLDSP